MVSTPLFKCKNFLKLKGALCQDRSIEYGFNKVRSHMHKFETFEHFITKAILSKLILMGGDNIITEHYYPDARRVDILQIKGKELIAYEVENKKNLKDDPENTSVITVDLRKIPQEVKQSFKILRKYFRRFIV